MAKLWIAPAAAMGFLGAGALGPLPVVTTPSGLSATASKQESQLPDHPAFTKAFDLSALPLLPREVPPPPPPPDPTMAFSATQFVGTISADGEFILLASESGTFHRLRLGDSYKGFTLTEVSAVSATFSVGETQIVRPVNQAPTEAVQ